MINFSSCMKSNLMLNLLHNLHVIRNALQSDKTRPTVILTELLQTAHQQMNSGAVDSSTFSISVQIILVKPMCLKQITDVIHSFTATHPRMKLDFIACVRSSLHCTSIVKFAAEVLHSQYLTS